VRSRWGRVQAAMIREMNSITFDELAADASPVLLVNPTAFSLV
jgi:hypothetical protein